MKAHNISLVTDARSAASEGRAAGAVFSTSVSWIGKRVLCDNLLSGVSRRVIAERYNISRNTVNAIRQVMDSRRELEPLKKEIARRLDRCVIYSLENLEQALADGEISAGQLPIAAATLMDKKGTLEGQPTARIEHVSTRKVTPEFLNAKLDSLTSPNLANTPDSASGGNTAQLPAPTDATEPDNA